MDNGKRSPILRYTLDAVPQVLRETAGEQTTRNLYGRDLFAQQQGETTIYLGYDALSVRLHLDEDGAIAATYRYGPYGEVVGEGPAGYGYTGEQWDRYIKMTFLRARYYGPEAGRFVSRDVFGGYINTPSSLHRYAYAWENPVNHRDPSGYWNIPATRRRSMLINYGRWLADNESDSLKSFRTLVDFASVLTNNTDDFVLDLDCVILGDCVDKASYCVGIEYPRFVLSVLSGRRPAGSLSDYAFQGQGSWSSSYYDFTYNQMFHFWMYVASTYWGGIAFPAGATSTVGNWIHDPTLGWQSSRGRGGCPREPIEQCDYDAAGNPLGLNVSLMDLKLGFEGIELGLALKQGYVKRVSVGNWIWDHLSRVGADSAHPLGPVPGILMGLRSTGEWGLYWATFPFVWPYHLGKAAWDILR